MATLDTTDPNWRKDLREEIIENHTFTLEITEIRVTGKRYISEEVDQYTMPPQLSTFRGAIKVANN